MVPGTDASRSTSTQDDHCDTTNPPSSLPEAGPRTRPGRRASGHRPYRAPRNGPNLGVAVPLSLTTVWWVGLAMVGVLVLFYLIAAYAPWLFYLGGGYTARVSTRIARSFRRGSQGLCDTLTRKRKLRGRRSWRPLLVHSGRLRPGLRDAGNRADSTGRAAIGGALCRRRCRRVSPAAGSSSGRSGRIGRRSPSAPLRPPRWRRPPSARRGAPSTGRGRCARRAPGRCQPLKS